MGGQVTISLTVHGDIVHFNSKANFLGKWVSQIQTSSLSFLSSSFTELQLAYNIVLTQGVQHDFDTCIY